MFTVKMSQDVGGCATPDRDCALAIRQAIRNTLRLAHPALEVESTSFGSVNAAMLLRHECAGLCRRTALA